MKIKQWFLKRKLWLRGGILGILICGALELFYVLLYFPVIGNIYGGRVPDWALVLPMITGHAFPVLSGFIVPYGWLCKFSDTTCTSWTSQTGTGGVPWVMDGQAGYCVVQTNIPTTFCANLSEIVGFFLLLALLFSIYFAVGAAIGKWLEKKKKT